MTWLAACVPPAALLVALLIDHAWGEPPTWAHPVVAMGRWLQWAGQPWPACPPVVAWLGGAVAWWVGAAFVTGLAWCLQRQLWAALAPGASINLGGWTGEPWPMMVTVARAVLLSLLLGVLLKPLLAWRMLRCEVLAVEAALAQSLPAGRVQVARLCSRSTDDLGALQVRETAIETLAENLNDSVVAPLFWWALAGLPGAALYRYTNTADAMWGYRGRWEWAGKWAAWADDALSWLPARLTGLLLLPSPARWPALRREAGRTPSPNGGWPMGAMALVLGVGLGKPGVYRLNGLGRDATALDTDHAVRRAGLALVGAALLLAALAAWLGSLRWMAPGFWP